MNQPSDFFELKKEIESRNDIKEAARVLRRLEERGLKECSIGSGYIRYHLTEQGDSDDIDVIYKGEVHFEEAQKILLETLNEFNIEPERWDVKGIWNIQVRFPNFTDMTEQFPYAFCCTIEAVVLQSDGLLHDLSGRGFQDAASQSLHLINLCNKDLEYTDRRISYFCLEGCRRICRFGWKPTEETKDFLIQNSARWNNVKEEDRQELILKRIKNKFDQSEYSEARKIYAEYGWGSSFDHLVDML